MLMDSPGEMTTQEWQAASSFRPPRELDEAAIRQLLDILQGKICKLRGGAKTTLVVHGGVLSVLLYRNRATTTDVDYIGRTVYENLADTDWEGNEEKTHKRDWKKYFARLHGRGDLGPDEMNLLIRVCVEETTLEYNVNVDMRRSPRLKLDWMNCFADVALPWTLEYVILGRCTSRCSDLLIHK